MGEHYALGKARSSRGILHIYYVVRIETCLAFAQFPVTHSVGICKHILKAEHTLGSISTCKNYSVKIRELFSFYLSLACAGELGN